MEVRSKICDGDACGIETRVDYTYDEYGNVTREDDYGDVNDGDKDNRTILRSFANNATDWIIGLPTLVRTFQGTSLQEL